MSRLKSPPEPGQEEFQTQWVGADSILFATAHRPWPLPTAPWIMTQRWNDLLFLHYPVDPQAVRAKVPHALTVDTYRQRAWVSITPFWINHLRPPGVPSLPWVSGFNEINVRTYVTYDGKPGVYFFSLDASNLSAVWGARMFYRLPYWQASMKVRGKGTAKIEYASKREHGPKPAELKLSYGPSTSQKIHAHPCSLEHFLTERYCLYTVTRKRLYRGEIHHLPWDLQAADVEIEQNSMAETTGLELPPQPELSYFSREIKVLFWAPERLL
jgi:uncharacterized protein YqjF (DUF2071 family)